MLMVTVLGWNCRKYSGNTETENQAIAGFYASQAPVDKEQLNIEVRYILAENCFKCHNSTKHKGALTLETKEGIFEGGENGNVIEVGNSAESEIVRRIKLSHRKEDAMPPEGPRLKKSEISKIALWIDEGAYWADTTLKFFREAPLALEKPKTPEQGHPIDAFVNQYFKKHKISRPESISDYRFIRKIYLDVLGLAPSIQEIEKFVNNTDQNKYPLLVDELLNDTINYALNWLSFWNDLLRNDYTGTGYITGGRKQISKWLYHALVENRSYDLMVEQLINPDEESEGFIAGIKWRGTVNASQRIELQAAQNISQALLGLNLKCASCHNSFVNNLTLDQAYAFANIFADSSLQIYKCDKPTGEFSGSEFIYPTLGEVGGDSLADRLASLANVIVQPQNGKLYRTFVNRIWDKFFGHGLVGTVDDMDQESWNQDLLDWLAADFRDRGSDIKHLLKTILSSETYRLKPSDLSKKDNHYTFTGPEPRKLSAEQFTDVFSQTIYPFYSHTYFLADRDTLPASPSWIWHREIELDRTVLPKPGTRWFRHSFVLDQDRRNIASARILATADSSFIIYLNGVEQLRGNDVRKVMQQSIGDHLFEEENIISTLAINDGVIPNPAGLLMTLRIQYRDGNTQMIKTSHDWLSTAAIPSNSWMDLNFQDTAWVRVKSDGEKGFWGYPIDFYFEKSSSAFARASLVRLDPFLNIMGRPTRENVTTTRESEATLIQAMTLANHDLLADNISRGAIIWKNKPGSNDSKLEELFFQLIGRRPHNRELRIMVRNINDNSVENWEDVIWSLLMLPEFNLI